MMSVDILVFKMEAGKKESILECIEISKLSRHSDNSWGWIRISAQVRLDYLVIVIDVNYTKSMIEREPSLFSYFTE